MRKINEIIIHCSATKEGKDYTVEQIDKMHQARGFKEVGYHFIVYRDGTIHRGRSLLKIGAHCLNHNSFSIGICYIGGLDADGKPKDTRTDAQREALRTLVLMFKEIYPDAKVLGHRDTSPDKNGNGIIEKTEWLKACPCFDVAQWFNEIKTKSK